MGPDMSDGTASLSGRVLKRKLQEVLTDDYKRLVKKLSPDIKVIAEAKERRLIVISGEDPLKQAVVLADLIKRYRKRLTSIKAMKKDETLKVLYIYHDEFPDARLRVEAVKRLLKTKDIEVEDAVYEISDRYLGTTYKVLVLDLVNDLKPDDVGRLTGIVEGGGLVFYLVPPLEKWPTHMTIFKQNLIVPGHPEPRHIFIGWFVRKLMKHQGIYVFDVDRGSLVKSGFILKKHRKGKAKKKIVIPENTLFPREVYEKALTQDQVNVVKLIERHILQQHIKKRLAIVITADRGRGKSCAVGIALAGLVHDAVKKGKRFKAVVTARNALSVQSMMEMIVDVLKVLGIRFKLVKRNSMILGIRGERYSIDFWEPMLTLRQRADIAVVDEAAGIPVPMLHRIWKSFKKTIYATTIHGYEGAGRGFSVRFLKALKEDQQTLLVQYEMEEPIRYSATDPIEKFLFDVFLLDAEPEKLDEEDLAAIRDGRLRYLVLDPYELFTDEGEKILRPLFGIFVLAHYRNEPDDLARIADAPHHSIRAVVTETGKIVGAVQVAEEGNIPDEQIEELMMGGRIPGNIIPDRLLKHHREREYGRGRGWRIVRIAVHIDVQGRGIGSFLLKELEKEARERRYDWVGAGFGVTDELLRFWIKNGYVLLHSSPDRNPVSGEYTVLVLKPLSREWEELVARSAEEFSVKLVESMHAVYKDLEPDAAYTMLARTVKARDRAASIYLTPQQITRLIVYVKGIMTFESVCDAVSLLVKKYAYMGRFSHLSKEEGMVTVMRVLQGRDWGSVYDEVRIGKGRATNILRSAVSRMLRELYGIRVELPDYG